MSTSTGASESVARAFARLIDYAGLFPPAGLAMPHAAREYLSAMQGRHAWMLGRYIVPASRIEELERAWEAIGNGTPVAVSAILDSTAERVLAGIAPRRRSAGAVAIEALEVPMPEASPANCAASIGELYLMLEEAGVRDLPVYVELPREVRFAEIIPDAMRALAAHRLRAKLRCGGLDASAVPSPHDVTAFITEAARAGVPFKATAGLHHPLRHYDSLAGFTMHGFINILAASILAGEVGQRELQALIEEESAEAFSFAERSLRWGAHEASLDAIVRAREKRFTGFGSCSFAEPVEDLTALGLVSE
jgi:hypothetical protein